MAPLYAYSGDMQGLPRPHHVISNREPVAKKWFSTRSAAKWNWHLIPTQKNKLHARQCISQRKKAVRDQGQTSSKFSFLEVLVSSLLGKNCNDLSAYPPTQLFRRGCGEAEAQQHQAHRAHRAELGRPSCKRQDQWAPWGGHPPSGKLPHLFKNWSPEKQASNDCSRQKYDASIDSTTSICLPFLPYQVFKILKLLLLNFACFGFVKTMSIVLHH